MKFSKLFLLIVIFFIGSSFSLAKSNSKVKRGNVIHFFASGKMQCLSQKDLEGNIYVLLKSLDKNTRIEFSKIDSKNPKKPIVVVRMFVEEETDICASLTHLQEVNISIDPKPVEIITLSGKTISKSGTITVMSAD